MIALLRATTLLLASAAVVLIPNETAMAQQPKGVKGKPADVFGDTKVLQIHISLTAKEYEAMQPPGGGGGFGFGFQPPPVNPPPKKDGQRDSDRSVFGTEFPWVHGAVAIDGVTVEDVGLRYKGNSTYLATARGLKRSIKIDFDHYNNKLHFHGLNVLNLHCGVHDPSKVRETVAYAMFRACGVPAPRTALAEVTLTVPGKYDKEYVGLYTVAEQVNKAFLKTHYKTDKGLLMKPERVGSLDYLGDDWERYKTTYQPKRDATTAEQKRVIDFTKLVNQAPDEQFRKEIASYLDVDAFLRYLAATALDVEPRQLLHQRAQLLPLPASRDEEVPLHPVGRRSRDGELRVLRLGRSADGPEPRQAVHAVPARRPAHGDEGNRRPLSADSEGTDGEQVHEGSAAKGDRRRRDHDERPHREGREGRDGARKAAACRASARRAARCSAARPRCERSRRSASSRSRRNSRARARATCHRWSASARRAVSDRAINFAQPLLDALDTNKDGKVSEAEFAAGMKKFFSEWDTNKDGVLDQKEITDGLQRLMPAPKGPFGGPPPKP